MQKPKVDWAAYDKSLIKRGSITFYLSDDMIDHWKPKSTGKQGGQSLYTDLAIEACLTLRLVFKQGLRQTEGLVTSLFEIMGITFDVPDHSTLSKRGKSLNISDPDLSNPNEPIVVALDSTGLKTYGAGEWSETKHGLSKVRVWRKLHISADTASLEIVESSLTGKDIGDPTEGERMLSRLKNPLKEILADGAYDSKSISKAANSKGIDGMVAVTIPPPKNAVLSKKYPEDKSQRDEHVDFINSNGRKAWEKKTGYVRRLLVENAIGRYKGIIGPKLRARSENSQKVEVSIGIKILNKMVRLGTPLRPNLSEI